MPYNGSRIIKIYSSCVFCHSCYFFHLHTNIYKDILAYTYNDIYISIHNQIYFCYPYGEREVEISKTSSPLANIVNQKQYHIPGIMVEISDTFKD